MSYVFEVKFNTLEKFRCCSCQQGIIARSTLCTLSADGFSITWYR